MRHNFWAYALGPISQLLNLWDATIEGCEPRDCSLTGEATVIVSLSGVTKSRPHSLQLEKAHAQQWRPSAAKINI